MGHFKKNNNGGFGGGNRGGFRQGGFKKKEWGGGRNDNRETVMHQTRCSDCGNSCEVPFKPTNGKPVFCKECFGDKDQNDNSFRSPRRDFGAKPQFKRDFGERNQRNNSHEHHGHDDLKKEINSLSVKMDRLIQSIENLNRDRTREMISETSEEKVKEVKKKKVAKKPSKK